MFQAQQFHFRPSGLRWPAAARAYWLATTGALALAAVFLFSAPNAQAAEKGKGPTIMSPSGPGLLLPRMDPVRGKQLFVTKGCVACHSVNGVGGAFASKLDVGGTVPYVSVFEFVSRMWRGAGAMIKLQQRKLGYTIQLTATELADITAFAHDRTQQKKFSYGDISPQAQRWMEEFKSR